MHSFVEDTVLQLSKLKTTGVENMYCTSRRKLNGRSGDGCKSNSDEEPEPTPGSRAWEKRVLVPTAFNVSPGRKEDVRPVEVWPKSDSMQFSAACSNTYAPVEVELM
jgi:hypothetical protein